MATSSSARSTSLCLGSFYANHGFPKKPKMQALAALVVLLASVAGSNQEAQDSPQEDFYVLNFPREPDLQLSLLDFVSLVQEATGIQFTYDLGTQKLLGSTKIVL